MTHEHASILSPDAILATAAPTQPIMTGIYFLISDGRIVYVGQSWNIIVRVASHATTKRFDSWAWIPCDREGLNSLERAYLNALLPEYNTDRITTRLKGGDPRKNIGSFTENPRAAVGAAESHAVPDRLYNEEIRMMRAARSEEHLNAMRVAAGFCPYETKADRKAERERRKREISEAIAKGQRLRQERLSHESGAEY